MQGSGSDLSCRGGTFYSDVTVVAKVMFGTLVLFILIGMLQANQSLPVL